MFFLFLSWGVVAGYFAGFLGIGAGVLLMPFFGLIGIPYQTAVDASLMAVFISSLTATIQNYRHNGIKWEPCIVIAIPGAIFALIGNIYLIHLIPVRLLEVIFAGLMFLNVDLLRIAQHIMLINAYYQANNNKRYFLQYLFIGAISGLMASLLGIGGGILIVSMLLVMADFDMKDAVKSAVVIMVATTFFSLISEIFQHSLPYSIGVPASLGAVIGGFLGTIALKYVTSDFIRRTNYVISFSLGIIVILKVLLL